MPTYYAYDVVITRKLVETQTFRCGGESDETAAGAAIQHAKAADWSQEYEWVIDSTTQVEDDKPKP